MAPDQTTIYVAQQDGRIFYAKLDVNFNVDVAVHEIDTIYNLAIGGRVA